MRYLYGDSVPFPPQYDFLAALEAFCTHASRVVRLDAESRALRKTSEESAIQRIKEVDELDAFHREAVGALKDGARDSTQALVQDYVRQLSELAQRLADEARRAAIRRATATRRALAPSATAARPRRATPSRSCSSPCACPWWRPT